MPRHILSVDDLSDSEIQHILTRATDFERGKLPTRDEGIILGLLFHQTSIRTRVGFTAAAARLGWASIQVSERRHDSTSMIESWEDTLRTLSGYLDILVARPGQHLSRELLGSSLRIPYISGGGVSPEAEHPSQALIDLYAIESECGPIQNLNVTICGDLRMRATRSLLRLFERYQPRGVSFVTVSELVAEPDIPPIIRAMADYRELSEIGDTDVLYVTGIPHKAIPESLRDTLRITEQALNLLNDNAIVLSPLPIIDEMTEEAKDNHRIRMFSQSSRGLFVRMALLESTVKSQ